MSTDQGASAKADRAATPSEPSQSSVVSGKAGIPCAFTPGPWALALGAAHETVEGLRWVQVTPPGNWPVMRDYATEADAHLIAAAPELYDALDDLLDAALAIGGAVDHHAMNAAKNALAKARGQ